jgi:D-alanyl-D-alanine carboxypeptidase
MHGDPEAGIGVIVFKNAMQNTGAIAEFALQSVVNALAGEPLPEPPVPEIDFQAYAGVYRSGISTLTVVADDGRLSLERAGERIPLQPAGFPAQPDTFLADHLDYALFPMRFGRDAVGSVVEVSHGAAWFVTDDYAGATTFETPPEWAAYEGHYRNYNPWGSNFRVVLRKGGLVLIHPQGQEEMLTAHGDRFRIGDDAESPERIAFDTIVDGQALRATQPGGEVHYRFFTP